MKYLNSGIENLNDMNRFKRALDLLNSEDWYPAHDAFEELWHETSGPERITIQAFLQIAVAQLHLENGNKNGATILYGEALGRLTKLGAPDLGFDIDKLGKCIHPLRWILIIYIGVAFYQVDCLVLPESLEASQ